MRSKTEDLDFRLGIGLALHPGSDVHETSTGEQDLTQRKERGMKFSTRWPFAGVTLMVAVALIYSANAGAAVFNTDAAKHDPTQQSGWGLALYCVGAPSTYGGGPGAPPAVKRPDLPATFFGCAVSPAVLAGVNATYATQGACEGAGYYWDSYVAINGYPNPCFAAFVTADADPLGTTWLLGENGCLRCHSTGQMAAIYGGPDSAKEAYLSGGHKNMSRPADGMKWGMPGVDATHPFLGDAVQAGLNPDGSFKELWIQEDYPRMPVGWTTPLLPALSSVAVAYCAKDGTGAISSDDIPDLAACPACESPVMGNGNAGYPLNYPDAASCALAATHTGKPYTWYTPGLKPLYWMYGGAGLEGGPPMLQPGSQQYKCGRCHTTGWTGNNLADAAVTGGTKHPWSDGLPTSATVLGGATKLTKTSTSTSYDYSSWDQWGIQCARCHVATDGGHSTWPTASTTGGDIVAACMTCHRMENDAGPRPNGGYNGTLPSNGAATPFTNRQQQPDGFAHHPDGPEFLNSPHAKFSGTWGQLGCPPYAINGYSAYGDGTVTEAVNILNPGAPAATACTPGTMNLNGSTSSLYASKFAQAAKVDLTGISDSAAGSCATCHDVHKPLVENVEGMSQSVKTECTSCHSNPSATISPQVDLALINHLGGAGTPLEHAATDPTSACEICHQPPGINHLWRINTDPTYMMYGDYTYAYPVNGASAAAAASKVNLPHYAADGTYTNAMWVDLDNACGQCHGGGVSETDVATTGSITAGGSGGFINPLTVANVFGFASGKEVEIAGAGWAGADFKTIIAKVVKDADPAVSGTVYLTYPTATTVSGAAVTVAGNPTANGAQYRTRATLAAVAKGMHDGAGVTYSVTFTSTSSGLTANVTGAVGCSSLCPTFDYDWDWGDGSGHGSGVSASHPYGSAGSKSITLTVTTAGKLIGSTTRSVTVTALDNPPVASGTCAWNANTWTMSVHDTSTDDNAVQTAVVVWGDSSSNSVGAGGSTFTHTYLTPGGPYTPTVRAIDASLQSNGPTACTGNTAVSPAYFAISGTVYKNNGTTPVPSAAVTVKKGSAAVKTVYTLANGTFSAGSLKPGTYTLVVTKAGYTFTAPAATITVGPTSTGNNISAVTP